MADAARTRSRVEAGGLALALMLLVVLATVLFSGRPAQAADSGVSVSLTDDAGGTALFPGVRLSPGDRHATCLSITATGAASADQVAFAAESVYGPLARWIMVDVEVGTGGGHGNCTGFAGSPLFSGSLTALGSVAGEGLSTGWYPAAGATRTFRITVEVVDDRAALGLSAGARFTWRLVGLARPSADPSADPTPISTPTLTSVVGPPATPTSPSGLSPSGLSPSGLSPSGLSPSGLSSSTGDGGDADLHLGPAAAPLAQTVIGVVRHPQPVLWSALAAVAFLLVQHRIDMSDPKLLGAFRTAREQMVVFPIDYRRWEES